MQTVEQGFKNFTRNLPRVQPHLFELADQVVTAAPSAEWNVLICDDIGGRLPVYFLRRVLKEAGLALPTRYVAGSVSLHDRIRPEVYTDYFQWMAHHLGVESLRPLLATELTSSGRSIAYLSERLKPVSDTVSTAAIVNKYPESMRTTYAGATGLAASLDVFYTFEVMAPRLRFLERLRSAADHTPKPLRDRMPQSVKSWGVPMTSLLLDLQTSGADVLPVAARDEARSGMVRPTYEAMEGLVTEYCQSRGIVSETQTAAAWVPAVVGA